MASRGGNALRGATFLYMADGEGRLSFPSSVNIGDDETCGFLDRCERSGRVLAWHTASESNVAGVGCERIGQPVKKSPESS